MGSEQVRRCRGLNCTEFLQSRYTRRAALARCLATPWCRVEVWAACSSMAMSCTNGAGMLRCRASAAAFVAWLTEHGYCSHTPRSAEGAKDGDGEESRRNRGTQVVVFSLGLYEALWGHYFLLPCCLKAYLSALTAACQGSSTKLVYKTEEAAPGKREDAAEMWPVKVLLVNRLARRLMASHGIPVGPPYSLLANLSLHLILGQDFAFLSCT